MSITISKDTIGNRSRHLHEGVDRDKIALYYYCHENNVRITVRGISKDP